MKKLIVMEKDVHNEHQKATFGRMIMDKDDNFKKEAWDSSTKKAIILIIGLVLFNHNK